MFVELTCVLHSDFHTRPWQAIPFFHSTKNTSDQSYHVSVPNRSRLLLSI